MSVVSGNLVQTPIKESERTVGQLVTVRTSTNGKAYNARIAGQGKLTFCTSVNQLTLIFSKSCYIFCFIVYT